LAALSSSDNKKAGWMALIDSFGDVSGSEKLSKALDKILDQIAQYETMMDKLRSGGKLSID